MTLGDKKQSEITNHFVNNNTKYDTPLFLGVTEFVKGVFLWALHHVETIECRIYVRIEIQIIT